MLAANNSTGTVEQHAREAPPLDADRFDDLTVAIGTDRRAVVRGVLAGAVAAMLGRQGIAEAGPTPCGAPGESCKKAADCCSLRCKKKRGKRRGRCKACGAAGTRATRSACASATGAAPSPATTPTRARRGAPASMATPRGSSASTPTRSAPGWEPARPTKGARRGTAARGRGAPGTGTPSRSSACRCAPARSRAVAAPASNRDRHPHQTVRGRNDPGQTAPGSSHWKRQDGDPTRRATRTRDRRRRPLSGSDRTYRSALLVLCSTSEGRRCCRSTPGFPARPARRLHSRRASGTARPSHGRSEPYALRDRPLKRGDPTLPDPSLDGAKYWLR